MITAETYGELRRRKREIVRDLYRWKANRDKKNLPVESLENAIQFMHDLMHQLDQEIFGEQS